VVDVGKFTIKVILMCWGRCRHSSANYDARGASGGKYKAQIGIFCILAAVERFSWISQNGKPLRKIGKPLRKIGKPLRKAERRCRKQKGIAEIF
jgi:hypothetical protein